MDLTTLVYSVFRNKGVYALLLGSGLSRAAEIPTGWDITLDLIRKIAIVQGDDAGDDPVRWYAEKFGQEPDYSDLLDRLASTADERRAILHAYIESTETDREEGRKVATRAHHVIADLVARGYVRVVLTTNFDRLLESALRTRAIEPVVVDSTHAVAGAPPLPHCRCVVVKLHGDYLDTRIKNTAAELSRYDEAMDRYLDRILDEFGLIVCGWSGAWDTALRDAITRCPNRRYASFWASRGKPHALAEDLIIRRDAKLISIESADDLFTEIGERVTALEAVEQPDPLDAKVAIARLKRYLAEDRYRIQLHDLVLAETHSVTARLRSDEFTLQSDWSPEAFCRRVAAYEAATAVLRPMLLHGAVWSNQDHIRLWARVIDQLIDCRQGDSGTLGWINLQWYPPIMLFYTIGIASVAAERYDILNFLFRREIHLDTRNYSYIDILLPYKSPIDRDDWRSIPFVKQRKTPFNDL